MSKDLCIEISADSNQIFYRFNAKVCFGIESVENLVAIRRNRLLKRYGETDNYLCQMLR